MCLECGGDLDKVCCNGVCKEKCKIVDGESCEEPFFNGPPCSLTCVLPGWECGLAEHKVWSGFTEKICNPEGCQGDCSHDTEWCWKSYECVPTLNFTLYTLCMNYIIGPIGPIPFPYFICSDSFPVLTPCYSCTDASVHYDAGYVHNDSCN